MTGAWQEPVPGTQHPYHWSNFFCLIHAEILRGKDLKSIKLNHCGQCIMISIVASGHLWYTLRKAVNREDKRSRR